MKAISVVQPYSFMICVSSEYQLPMREDTDHRGKLLVCAGSECLTPSLEGIVTNHAMAVVELVDSAPLTADQAKSFEGEDNPPQYVWTLKNPRLVVPFGVEEQVGLFEVFADIEYISDDGQFNAAYCPFVTDDTPFDVANAYEYISFANFGSNDKSEDIFRPY